MPLLDLFPSRVTLHESGFELRWRRATQRIEWDEIRSARVERRLVVQMHSGTTLEVPRNAYQYIELFETMRRKRLVTLPTRLEWTSTPTVLSLLAWGALVASVGVYVWAFFPVLLVLGVGLLALAPLAWERYTATEGCLVRVSIFGRQEYGSELRGVTALRMTILGYPWSAVLTPSWWFHPRGGTPELAAAVINRAPPFLPGTTNESSASRTLHPWLIWVPCMLFVGLAPSVMIGACLLPVSTIIALLLTSGRLLVRFRDDGLWRLTIFGPRFDSAASFVAARRVENAVHLIRHDGTLMQFLLRIPVDWILRHWMPNPVSSQHEGYRSTTRGANLRSVGSYAFVAGAARPGASPAPSHDNAPRVMRSRTRR